MGRGREAFMGRRCRSRGPRRVGLRARLRGAAVCPRAYARGQMTRPRKAATIAAVSMS
jgi:hypothetical protein